MSTAKKTYPGPRVRLFKDVICSPLPERAKKACIKKAQSGDRVAAKKIVVHHLKFAYKIAGSYYSKHLTRMDLLHYGVFGILKAIKKYKPSKGAFTTYCYWWIRQAISRAIVDYDQTIRIPVYRNDEIRAYIRAITEFRSCQKREPTLKEIARKMNVPVKRVKDIISCMHSISSFDKPTQGGDEETTDLYNYITTSHDSRESFEQREDIKVLLRRLTDRQKYIVMARYGLLPAERGAIKTYQILSDELHISRERIRQIEVAALGMLRKSKQFREMCGFYLKR